MSSQRRSNSKSIKGWRNISSLLIWLGIRVAWMVVTYLVSTQCYLSWAQIARCTQHTQTAKCWSRESSRTPFKANTRRCWPRRHRTTSLSKTRFVVSSIQMKMYTSRNLGPSLHRVLKRLQALMRQAKIKIYIRTKLSRRSKRRKSTSPWRVEMISKWLWLSGCARALAK